MLAPLEGVGLGQWRLFRCDCHWGVAHGKAHGQQTAERSYLMEDETRFRRLVELPEMIRPYAGVEVQSSDDTGAFSNAVDQESR